MPNTIHRGGTITDEKEITIIRNDLEELGLDNRLSIATDSRDLWFSDETDAAKMPVGTVLKRNAVKFLMYSTYDCQVVVRSQSQGWHFEVTKPPIPPTENGTGASTYTSETIGLLENVDDLEIIVLTN